MSINLTRYSGVFLTAMFAIIALSVALDVMLSYPLPPGLVTILPAMSAAQMEGQHFVRSHGRKMESAEAWRATFAMTGVAFMFTAMLFLIQLAIPGVMLVLTDIPRAFLFGIVVFVMLIVFLTNRVFLSSGMASETKRQARQARG